MLKFAFNKPNNIVNESQTVKEEREDKTQIKKLNSNYPLYKKPINSSDGNLAKLTAYDPT